MLNELRQARDPAITRQITLLHFPMRQNGGNRSTALAGAPAHFRIHPIINNYYMLGNSFLHFIKHRLRLEAAVTQTTALERDALGRHVQGRRRVAEIGVYEGVTTNVLLQNMAKKGVLYAIDPFFAGRLGICWGKWIARREVLRANGARRVRWLEKLSFEAAGDIESGLDFLFIDGDHSWDGISKDWKVFAPLFEPGGIIALHDTRPPAHHPEIAELGSCQFFNEVICRDSAWEIVEQVDSLSVIRRLG